MDVVTPQVVENSLVGIEAEESSRRLDGEDMSVGEQCDGLRALMMGLSLMRLSIRQRLLR